MQNIINMLAEYSSLISTLFFFVFFVSMAIWVLLPRNKKRIESLKEIPFKDEDTNVKG